MANGPIAIAVGVCPTDNHSALARDALSDPRQVAPSPASHWQQADCLREPFDPRRASRQVLACIALRADSFARLESRLGIAAAKSIRLFETDFRIASGVSQTLSTWKRGFP
jgi:hypothetical protein